MSFATLTNEYSATTVAYKLIKIEMKLHVFPGAL